MKPQLIPLSQLLVNHENPRFEPVKNEQQAINLMMTAAGDEVFNLAKDIAQHSMNPSKSLMVVQVGSKFLPLDGNRRVVALKLLHEPELSQNRQFRDRFADLKRSSGAGIPQEVSCVVFPDKESAYRWVNLEHTGKNDGVGIVGWDSAQRQRFMAHYAGKKLSRSVQLIDFAEENTIKHDKVDSTTLDRLLGTPTVRKLIGVDFPKSLLELNKPMDEVLRNLRKLFAAMSHDDFKVSKVYTSKQAALWVSQVLDIVPKSAGRTRPPKGRKTTTKAGPLDFDWITTQLQTAYPHKNRVKAILGELKALSPDSRPNICATSLRVLLELAVYVYLKEKGVIAIIIQQEKSKIASENKKRGLNRTLQKDWAPSFQRMLNHLSNEETLISDPLDRKALGTFIGKRSTEPFVVELNQFIHNPSYDPTSASVFEIWSKLGKRIFKMILAS